MSGRYATALFELARDEKAIDAVKADLDKFEKQHDKDFWSAPKKSVA